MKFYRFLVLTFVVEFSISKPIEGQERPRRARRYVATRTGIRNAVKNSNADSWSRGEVLLSCTGISKEQIKRNRTRPTSMKHSSFRKGNDPRCIYTIEVRFSPHRTTILHPYGNGDCNASVFRFSVARIRNTSK